MQPIQNVFAWVAIMMTVVISYVQHAATNVILVRIHLLAWPAIQAGIEIRQAHYVLAQLVFMTIQIPLV